MSATTIGLIVAGVVAVVFVLSIAGSVRLATRPGRTRPWSDPKREVGLEYEDVEFPAQDGVRLRGWFMPAARSGPAPAIVMVHGWPWCRMGTRADNLLKDLPGSRPVNMLPLARSFHDAGYAVLTFDVRNFGESESRGVVTTGLMESRDLIGALEYLATRSDVDAARMGAIGFSMGGATIVFAMPHTDRMRAAIAIQPATTTVFSDGYARALFPVVHHLIVPIVQLFYRLAGGGSYDQQRPVLAAAGARSPILFVQGTGDPWGSREDVGAMAEAAPLGTALFPETSHRFEGYRWIIEHPEVAIAFFDRHVLGQQIVASPTEGAGPIRATQAPGGAS